MKNKAEVEFRVSTVAEHLEKGEATSSIIAAYAAKWNVTPRTIATYIAKAKDVVAERNSAKRAVIDSARNTELAIAERQNLMSDIELEQVLCSIIKGELELEKRVIVSGQEKVIRYKPSHYEIVLAIDKLWKKRGAYPIEKKQQIENQNLVIQYNLQKPEDIKYIENV